MSLDSPVFDDVFVHEGRQAPSLSVGEAVSQLASLVEGQLARVWIQGEVSNYSLSQAGHEYFTLKDDKAQIQCVRFAFERQGDDRVLTQGMRIEVWGHASVYVKGGTLQLRFERWRPAGLGALYAQYIERKRRLEAEGLFFRETKPRLPVFIRRVAVVSSPHAAGLQDVIATLRRRYPWIVGQLFGAKVQGNEAPQDLIRALDRATAWGPDVILMVRGGGSFEDLLAFSDESLTRAVAACPIPIVAGIGHETDESLVGLAASLCASTPTAAAEMLGPDAATWHQRLDQMEFSLKGSIRQAWQQAQRHTQGLLKYWSDPQAMIAQFVSQVTWQADKLVAITDKAFNTRAQGLWPCQDVFKEMLRRVEGLKPRLDTHADHMRMGVAQYMHQRESRLASVVHHPAWLLSTRWQALDWRLEQWSKHLERGMDYHVQALEERFSRLSTRVVTPQLQERALWVERHAQAWDRSWMLFCNQQAMKVETLAERLAYSNPHHWQAQGWAPVKRADGAPLIKALDAKLEECLTVQYLDGHLHVVVKEKLPS